MKVENPQIIWGIRWYHLTKNGCVAYLVWISRLLFGVYGNISKRMMVINCYMGKWTQTALLKMCINEYM